jgi:hypothetical protein
MRGFESPDAAGCFCREHGELRNLLRPRRCHNQIVPASLRRSRFVKAAQIALDITRRLKRPVQTCARHGLARDLTEPNDAGPGDGSASCQTTPSSMATSVRDVTA